MKSKKETKTSFSFFVDGIKTLWGFLGGEKKTILFVLAMLAVANLLTLSGTYLLKLVFDMLPNLGVSATTTNIFLLIVGISTVTLTATFVGNYLKELPFGDALIRLENRWPQMAHEKLLSLSVTYHERENTGKKIAKIDHGCNKMVVLMGDLFWQFLPSVFFLILNLFFILVIDWKLGVLFFIPFIPSIILIHVMYEKFCHEWDRWGELKENATGIFCQGIINVRTVQGYVRERNEQKRFGIVRTDMEKIDLFMHRKIRKYYFVIEALLHLSFVLTLGVGIYFYIAGISTLGSVVFVIATGNVVTGNIFTILHSYREIMHNIVYMNRVKSVMDETSIVENKLGSIVPKVNDIKSGIEFEKVTFAYPEKSLPAIENMNLSIPVGKMVALVGKSGEGKSTIVTLLCRMVNPSGGVIMLDGIDIKDIDLFWYRKQFAIVPQDVEIFDMSLLDNVCFGVSKADEVKVKEALDAAYLTSLFADVGRFPQGVDTMVGERGVLLSGGERQRVGIARAYLALLHGAQVLVLDEATSSLDSESEKAIQEMLRKLQQESSVTIIAIAHRLSTVQKADIIYVINNKQVVEKGDHDVLMASNGLYRRLVDLQTLSNSGAQ
ncbi:hypothetical protein CL630_00845 [bacterium]|nr:hypothetical protein [bacterium]|tara:strand:- start:28429 stop:30252 length:1824 start_codon:yes stop_codon:yes gene_type:complete